MAIVSGPVATITFNLVDETGSRSSFQLYQDFATPVADIVTDINAIIDDIEAVSGCATESWSINYSGAENATLTANPDSRVERKGLFVMNTEVPTKYTRIAVPGFLPTLLTDGGRIDEDNVSVAAFVSQLVTAGWTDSSGNDITGLRSAYERYNSTTRRQLPSVRVPDTE